MSIILSGKNSDLWGYYSYIYKVMQVLNDKKFISLDRNGKFGVLYKTSYAPPLFLNTFTACIYAGCGLQFLYIMHKYGNFEMIRF